ncbi:MAG TPA: (2Fe-2S) ferredoxin domain-containing protein [Bacillota bacterium]|jgi:(2Fe-2S) ferredoxin
MKSLKDLDRIRGKALEMTRVRQGQGLVKLVVGMGTCGIAAGARDVMAAILDELQKRNLTAVTVSQTGCVGLCDREPLVDVIKSGEPRVTYGRVTPEVARRIVAEHIVNDQILGEWVIATTSV